MITLSDLAGKFDRLLERLPGTIRKFVDREWVPLKELIVQRRPARILIVGSRPETFFRELFNVDSGRIEESENGWHTFYRHGDLHFAIAGELLGAAKSAITVMAPDLVLFVAGEENKVTELAMLSELHRFDRDRYQAGAPIVAVGVQTMELRDALHADPALSPSIAAVLPVGQRQAMLAAIFNALPRSARMEFARVSGEKALQHEIAVTLTRSASGLCGAIGAQPIPLADFPILTALQVLLVAGIVHVAGRKWNADTAKSFLGALGVNVGAGLDLRETARALVKIIPGWGNAISGAIAAAGTYAIGRAASSYFIEGMTLDAVRKRFRKERKPKPPELPER